MEGFDEEREEVELRISESAKRGGVRGYNERGERGDMRKTDTVFEVA